MQNGALSGLPYLVMWVVMIVSGFVADLLRTKRILRTTTVRKLCNGIGESLTASSLERKLIRCP